MVCKAGMVCKNCAECFGCHAMKSATVVGNCRPKNCRICPKEKALRRAEEQTQKSNGGQSSFQNNHLAQSTPSISKTICGGTTSYVIRGECSMSIDQFGRHIRFPQYSGLTFSSMESAFGYFEAQAKLQNQPTFQATRQLADLAAQQAHRSRAVHPCERIWQFDTSLEPANVKPVVRLPTYSYLGFQGHPFESVVDRVLQGIQKAPDPVQPPSRSSPPEPPPQTLFTESTPHAQNIPAQPRARLAAQVLQSWALHSQATNGSNLKPPLPSSPAPTPGTLVEDHTALYNNHNVLSASFSQDEEILAQPQSSYGSFALPPAYSATVLPQTLARKDKRVLGIPLTADIDEIRAGFWLRVLQYNADRCQATSLEDRAVAALKLTRAQEAMDRLSGDRA